MLSLFSKLGEIKGVIATVVVVFGVLATALGISKVPSQQRVIAEKLEAHNKRVAEQTDETNRKLDVLICLQAKLDTPLRCVARDR